LLIKESESGTDQYVYLKKGFSEESMNLETNQQKSKTGVIARTLPAKGEECCL
jgi:hypothetical protein